MPFGEYLDLTTFLTIDRIRTLGNNGAESSGKHGLSEQKPLNGAKKVRKKIIDLFGFKMPGVRISPLGPKKKEEFLLFLLFFTDEGDSKIQMQRG